MISIQFLIPLIFLGFLPWTWALSSPNSSKPIPITVLSGFLGSGKTTLLQNMLQNKQGLKIGVVVNDVASVNIDSKLVAQGGNAFQADGMVELQNGCACCTLSDELLTSISNLVTMSDLRKQSEDDDEAGFHHIVIELSGVADPKAVRAKFQEAIMEQMPLMERVQLDTMVSLVDCSTFESHFQSTQLATREEMPQLFYPDGQAPEEPEMDEWMKDLPPKLLEVVLNSMRGNENGEAEGVADLLTSQTETADLVVLNKKDLVDGQELDRLREIVAALNPRASVMATSFGQVDLEGVLGVAGGQGVAVAGAVDDHRDYVMAATKNDESIVSHVLLTEGDSLSDDHNGSHDHALDACADATCNDSSHSHSHAHDHASESCADPTCDDPSHSHSHSHSHAAEVCSDPSHSHDHVANECADPVCTDPSHSHSHSHHHAESATYAGIGSFVYRSRRPFHPGRLISFLRYLPVVRGIPQVVDNTDLLVSAETQSTLKQCLRSKGFVWCANSHTDALYWSHAGSSFELSCLGQWWATLPRDQWPDGVAEYVLRDFDSVEHDDSTNPLGVGDRRQEIVFIGPGLGKGKSQQIVTESLDQCLLTDKEYKDYKSMAKSGTKLLARFPNILESKYVTY